MPIEYGEVVDKAVDAYTLAHENEVELEGVREKLKRLVARMDLQDESMGLMRQNIALLQVEISDYRAFVERINRYLKECCGVSQESKEAIDKCDRNQVDDQRALQDVS